MNESIVGLSRDLGETKDELKDVREGLASEKQARKEEKAMADLRIGALEKSNGDLSAEVKVAKSGKGKFSVPQLLGLLSLTTALSTGLGWVIDQKNAPASKDIAANKEMLAELKADSKASSERITAAGLKRFTSDDGEKMETRADKNWEIQRDVNEFQMELIIGQGERIANMEGRAAK